MFRALILKNVVQHFNILGVFGIFASQNIVVLEVHRLCILGCRCSITYQPLNISLPIIAMEAYNNTL